MREVITIQILRPNFEDMHPEVAKEMIEQMSKDIAQQIVTQEKLRHMHEDLVYWQRKLLTWEVEDQLRRHNG